MDDIRVLVERALIAIETAEARLEAGRRARWHGIAARAYAARLAEADFRVAHLRSRADAACPPGLPWVSP